MRFHGVIPPIVTPMKADESLDLDGLRRGIDHLLGHGVHGVFVLGTTREVYALEREEKQAGIAAPLAHLNRRRPVIARTGAPNTRRAGHPPQVPPPEEGR